MSGFVFAFFLATRGGHRRERVSIERLRGGLNRAKKLASVAFGKMKVQRFQGLFGFVLSKIDAVGRTG